MSDERVREIEERIGPHSTAPQDAMRALDALKLSDAEIARRVVWRDGARRGAAALLAVEQPDDRGRPVSDGHPLALDT